MDKIIQCNVLMNNEVETDFQMRTFEYESFEKLLNDFETRDDIIITKSRLVGNLRPRHSLVEIVQKDDFHAKYIIKTTLDAKFKVMFYKE